MALLRARETDEYWAEYAVLVVRDRDGEVDCESVGLLGEFATEAQPGGTIALAGVGWLWARASSGDGDNEVRLEAHDGEPPGAGGLADVGDWDDVMETPYLSSSGTVGLSMLTGGDHDEHTLVLGPPGHYRVRVCCRRPHSTGDAGDQEPGGDTWRLQFWPAPGDPEPPRWLVRAPDIPDDSPEWNDWTLDPEVSCVLRGARIAIGDHPEGASAAQIAAERDTESRSSDTSPGALLWPPQRPPLTTGHPDIDEIDARTHARLAADMAGRQRAVNEMAAGFGLPALVTVGDVIPLLVRMGLLSVSGDGGQRLYRLPAGPPEQAAATGRAPSGEAPGDRAPGDRDEQEIVYASADQAADLVAVTLWTPAGRVGTVAELADRVLMSPEQVRAALRYAEQEQLLRVVGDPYDSASQLTLTALPRREEPAGEPRPLRLIDPGGDAVIPDYPQVRPLFGEELPRTSARLIVARLAVPAGHPPLPEGMPPRAGIITRSGNLVVWQDGSARVRDGVPGDAFAAVDTPHGVVVLSLGDSVLVRHDGQVEVLAKKADYRAAVSADGRYLAVTNTRHGRRPSFALHVIDLADCSRQTLRWPDYLSVDGMYGGAVYFGTADAGSLRWTPGSDPEPLPWRPRTVDRISGVMLVDGSDEDVDGWLVIGQDGARHNVLATGAAELALGGTQMMYFRYDPPAITLFDVATGGADPRVVWLPEGSDTSMGGWAWEDPGHLLFSKPHADDAPAVRLDVRTGAVEGVHFPGVDDGDQVSAFVESGRACG